MVRCYADLPYREGIIADSSRFYRDPKKPYLFALYRILEWKRSLIQREPEILAGKPILCGMQQDALGDEVLVKRGVQLFYKICPSRFEHTGDFSESSAPINHMVEHTEAKDRVQ